MWFITGSQAVWGPGGPAWPDEPLWKLSGFFDPTFDQSVRGGVTALDTAIADHPNEALVIYGYSQGAIIANIEKQKLADQYPEGTDAPDIDFVLSGDINLPNGGLTSRFAGLYIPILDVSFNGPAPTDTQFDTVEDRQPVRRVLRFPAVPAQPLRHRERAAGRPLRASLRPGPQRGRPRTPSTPSTATPTTTSTPPTTCRCSAPLRQCGSAGAGDRRVRAGLQGDRGAGLRPHHPTGGAHPGTADPADSTR